MNCPICGKPYESMKRNKFGGAEYHHAGDPLNVFCQQSSASYKAAQQNVQRIGGDAPLEDSPFETGIRRGAVVLPPANR